MPYVYFNDNPRNQRVGDCSVRAVSKATGKNWEEAYLGLCSEGLIYADMPSSNYVWGMFLRKYGYVQKTIDSVCPKCTTVAQFADEHPKGSYVLTCQSHVVTCIDGNYYDSWDSGDEIVLYYFEKEY
jgi:hypothetical protein